MALIKKTVDVNITGTNEVTGSVPVKDALSVVPSYLMNTPSVDFAIERATIQSEALYEATHSFSSAVLTITSLKCYVKSTFGGMHYVEVRTPVTLDMSTLASGEYALYVEIIFTEAQTTELNFNIDLKTAPAQGLKVIEFNMSGGVISGSTAINVRRQPSEGAYLSTDTDGEVDGHLKAKSFGNRQNELVRFALPEDATFSSNAPVSTGAIAITLPTGKTSTMMSFDVKIYDYNKGKSFTLNISARNNVAGWHEATCVCIADKTYDLEFAVRFGHNQTTGKDIVYIGELDSEWEFLEVSVPFFQGGQNIQFDDWKNGWSIGLETTSFLGVTLIDYAKQVGRGYHVDEHNDGFTRIINPKGGVFVSNLSSTSTIGAIKIALPLLNSFTMITIDATLFEFDQISNSNNRSVRLVIDGYNQGSGTWSSTQCISFGDPSRTKELKVRFGRNDSNSIIYIGELNTQWNYLKFSIDSIKLSHLSSKASQWVDGYSVTLEKSGFENVSSTKDVTILGKRIGTNLIYHEGNLSGAFNDNADLVATETERGVAKLSTNTQIDAGTDGTTIVTPAGLQRKANSILGSPPDGLNTLEELAGAIANDPDYHQTISSQINAINSYITEINNKFTITTIYVNEVSGIDSNDGATEQTALKTLKEACSRINHGVPGRIIIGSNIVVNDVIDISGKNIALVSDFFLLDASTSSRRNITFMDYSLLLNGVTYALRKGFVANYPGFSSIFCIGCKLIANALISGGVFYGRTAIFEIGNASGMFNLSLFKSDVLLSQSHLVSPYAVSQQGGGISSTGVFLSNVTLGSNGERVLNNSSTSFNTLGVSNSTINDATRWKATTINYSGNV